MRGRGTLVVNVVRVIGVVRVNEVALGVGVVRVVEVIKWIMVVAVVWMGGGGSLGHTGVSGY